jgi:hypothetical protein
MGLHGLQRKAASSASIVRKAIAPLSGIVSTHATTICPRRPERRAHRVRHDADVEASRSSAR